MSWRTRANEASTQIQPTAAAFTNPQGTYGRQSAQQQQLAHMQRQQAQYLQQQQDLYNLQQAQMTLQLEAMKLQNLSIQERLLSAAQQQLSTYEEMPMLNTAVPAGYVNQLGHVASGPTAGPEETLQTRRGALQNLQRAQQHRSDTIEVAEPAKPRQGNRLSFGGGEGLAEHALARKAAAAHAPGHTRQSSSQGSASSFSSGTLSETRKEMSSPNGPKLVLSEPGEAFPAQARRLLVTTGRPDASEDGVSSSSPSSESDSSASEVLSFESTTSISSNEAGKSRSASVGSKLSEMATPTVRTPEQDGAQPKPLLNPTASAFTPGAFARPSTLPTGPTRNFSAPPVMSAHKGSYAIRQPRGPASDHEMEAKNFGGRIRRQAVNALKLKTRPGSSPSSPISPTFAPNAGYF